MKVLLLLAAGIVCLMALLFAGHRTLSCRYSGYDRAVVFERGNLVDEEAMRGGRKFPAMEESRFSNDHFDYDYYDRLVQCSELLVKQPGMINIVRFTVGPEFKFVPSSPENRSGKAALRWRELPTNLYSPVTIGEPQYIDPYADESSNDPRRRLSWFESKQFGYEDPGEKHFIESLGIGWLKEEPLDEKYILGVWQSGWLFRSVKPGYYIWIG